MIKVLLTLFVLICTVSVASGEGISVSQSVDKTSIPFEDSVTFEVTLKWDGPQLAYLFERPLNPVIDRLKIRGFSSSVNSSEEAGREVTTKKFRFVLVPTISGLGTIDPINISYITWPDSLPGQLVTEAQTINIADPKPVVAETERPLWLWILAAVLLERRSGWRCFSCAVVPGRRSSRSKPRASKFLDDLSGVKLEAGSDLKKFQTGLYRALTNYIKFGCNFDPTDLPDDELKQKLVSSGLSANQAEQLSVWMKQALKDKYSPVVAGPGETIRLESEIRQFFERL